MARHWWYVLEPCIWPKRAGPVCCGVRSQVALTTSPTCGVLSQISGENFGHPKFASYAVMEVVFFKDVCNAIKTQRCKDGIATGAECACSVVDHTHDSITITTPPGIGVDREVKVAVSEPPVNAQRTATTDPATFNYDPPVVELVIPNRANAQGEPSIQVRQQHVPGAAPFAHATHAATAFPFTDPWHQLRVAGCRGVLVAGGAGGGRGRARCGVRGG